MSGGRTFASSLACVVAAGALALSGCGENGDGFEDGEIVDALELEEESGDYIVDGDPFCVLSGRFFHDSGEVAAAKGTEDAGVIIASRAGNVAVEGLPPFAPDCKRHARKKLDRLDPPAARQ